MKTGLIVTSGHLKRGICWYLATSVRGKRSSPVSRNQIVSSWNQLFFSYAFSQFSVISMETPVRVVDLSSFIILLFFHVVPDFLFLSVFRFPLKEQRCGVGQLFFRCVSSSFLVLSIMILLPRRLCALFQYFVFYRGSAVSGGQSHFCIFLPHPYLFVIIDPSASLVFIFPLCFLLVPFR